jgi:lysophospholipase L1-like esterase
MLKFVFQGDSITDAGRDRDNEAGYGVGYPNLFAAEVGKEFHGEYYFINEGISGNRIVDLYARIKSDFINLKPDYASIFIGVNDTWHEIGSKNGVATDKFEKIYTMLIDEVKEALPDIKLIIISPFVLEGTATVDADNPDKFDSFKKDVEEKAEVCRKIAEKYGLPLIELQPVFDEALKKAPADYWTRDGVHPTANGHEIIKRLWLDAFNEVK